MFQKWRYWMASLPALMIQHNIFVSTRSPKARRILYDLRRLFDEMLEGEGIVPDGTDASTDAAACRLMKDQGRFHCRSIHRW